MTTTKIRGVKGGADTLTPERRALIDGVRALLESAIDGTLESLSGVAEKWVTEEGERCCTCESVLLGVVESVPDVMRHLHHTHDMVDELDGASWTRTDEEEEEDEEGGDAPQ